MSLKGKRKMELDSMKERRMEEVIAAAVLEMQEKGIDNAKISDIAQRAEVGVASVYRYFKTKQELVIAAATQLWSDEISILYGSVQQKAMTASDSMEKIKILFEAFIELYQNHKGFVRFVEEFDNYIIKEKIDVERLADYESKMEYLKDSVFDAIEQGQADGTIRKDLDINSFYISITHTLMSLVQKLVLRGTILESDMSVNGESQLRLIIDMATTYIKQHKKMEVSVS